jgi:hypothetical protein
MRPLSIVSFLVLLMLTMSLSGCIDEQSRDDDGDDASVSPSISQVDTSAEDHEDYLSSATNDNLINFNTTIIQNEQLIWSDLIITIAEDDDGTNEIICTNPGQTQSNDCIITEVLGNGDNYFDLEEVVTISENGVDLCSPSSCSISHVILYRDSIRMSDDQPSSISNVYVE